MKRKTRSAWFPTIAAAALAISTIAAVHTPGGDTSQNKKKNTARQAPTPVVSTHELMELFNKELYKYLQKAMAQEPTSDKGWSAIEDRGYQVAEVANLVALRQDKRAPRQEWIELSTRLQEAGTELVQSAKSKNWQQTLRAYRGVIERCNACHQKTAPDSAPSLKP